MEGPITAPISLLITLNHWGCITDFLVPQLLMLKQKKKNKQKTVNSKTVNFIDTGYEAPESHLAEGHQFCPSWSYLAGDSLVIQNVDWFQCNNNTYTPLFII